MYKLIVWASHDDEHYAVFCHFFAHAFDVSIHCMCSPRLVQQKPEINSIGEPHYKCKSCLTSQHCYKQVLELFRFHAGNS